MKLLFTADLHIKLGQKNVPKTWVIDRFHEFINQFEKMQNKADFIVIGGDIFDRVPTMQELELYFDFIFSLRKPTIIYSGNHEAIKKNTTFLSYLKEVTSRVNIGVEVIDTQCNMHGVDILPYNCLHTEDYRKTSRILCTHVRGEIPPHVKPEIDLSKLARWDVVLSGDLHSYENSQTNILYPGSPYTITFHRAPVKTGAILLDTETLEHEWLQFNLPQLIRKTVTAGSETPKTDLHHTIYEVSGDISELASVTANALIDRKIVSRSKVSTLEIEHDLNLTGEVAKYLEVILEMSDNSVTNVLAELQKHLKELDL